MSRIRMTSMLCVLIVGIGALPVAAQSVTLKLKDIKGSSVVDRDAIDISSFGWSATTPSTMTSAGLEAGKAQSSEVALGLMSVDVLPQILQKLLSGGHSDEAKLTVWDASQKPMYSILFTQVFFVTLGLSGQTGAPPFHTLTFSFEKLEFTVPGSGPGAAFDFSQYKVK